MKKKAILLVGIVLLILLAAAWLYGYSHRKNNDNLPSLSALFEMDEAHINRIVSGYRRTQLHTVWGEPDSSDPEQDIWTMGDVSLFVSYHHNDDRAVVCALSVMLFPENTQEVQVTRMLYSTEETRTLRPEEMTEVIDWAKNLDLEQKTFADGQAPNQQYAGGEGWRFYINGGQRTFSYLEIDDSYILCNGAWYLVQNPSSPPVEMEE